MALTPEQIAQARTRLRKLRWAMRRLKAEAKWLQDQLTTEAPDAQQYQQLRNDVQEIIDVDGLPDPQLAAGE